MSCHIFSKNCTSYYTFVPRVNTSLVYNQYSDYENPTKCLSRVPLEVSNDVHKYKYGYGISVSTSNCTIYESARNQDKLSNPFS